MKRCTGIGEKMKTAVIFLADGFEECEALIVVDILRRAGIETIMGSIMGRIEVQSSRNIWVRSDAKAEDIDFNTVDLIFLPGGRLGTENLEKCDIVKKQCLEFADRKMIAAICAAPSILAGLGLLEGKKATCHPDFENQMFGAILAKDSVTVDGNIITGQGLGATFEFAFKLTEMLVSKDIVQKIKKAICWIDWRIV